MRLLCLLATISALALSGCGRGGGSIAIMPMGDSITQGDTAYASYRKPLWDLLRKRSLNVDFVGSMRRNHGGRPPAIDFDQQHEGHWGWRVDELLQEADGWVEESAPDYVLLLAGINDLYQRQPVEETANEIEALLGVLLADDPATRVLLGAVLPVDQKQLTSPRTPDDINARVEELNQMLRARIDGSETLSVRVVWVSLGDGFNPALHTHDGIHPNGAGEDLLAREWFDALTPLLK